MDGHRHQDSTTGDLIFGVARLVSVLSAYFMLYPGDISTGTPQGMGLGQRPPNDLRAGQAMRLGIDELGEQRQRVIDDPEVPGFLPEPNLPAAPDTRPDTNGAG